MTLNEARQRYELADSEQAFWEQARLVATAGTKASRIAFRALDVASTKREEALAELWRAMDS